MSFEPTRAVNPVLMVLLALFPIIAMLACLWVAKAFFGVDISDVDDWFAAVRHSPYAKIIIIAVFVAGSFMSLPQWALFVAAIGVFGPVTGGVLSWIGTLTSASVNFIAGHRLGRARFERYLKPDTRLDRFMVRLRENGALASFAVRFVPTGPFVLVNMLAGASGLRYRSFFVGTALGIIPKIMIVAFIAQGVIAKESSWLVTMVCVLAALVFVGVIWALKRRLGKNR